MSSKFSSTLKEFADNLAPSEALVREAGNIIDRLTRYLHNSRFSWSHRINRIVPLGSYAKKSSLRIMMDLDIVIYLNDCHYPFKEFLTELLKYISANEWYSDCKFLGRGLFLIAEGTLHIDLLPATNRVDTSERSRGKNARISQYEATLSYIKRSLDPAREGSNQSTALSETAVEFVKRKNDQYHCSTVARLAKFWSKTVCIEGFHYGRSSIMEYIAIRSTEIEQRTGRENTLNAFRSFLEEISNPEKLAIFWTDYYPEDSIPRRLKNSRPLLMDPTNPYNNMLNNEKTQQFMLKMATFAGVTLRRLELAEQSALRREPIDLNLVFTPQPGWVQLPFRFKKDTKPRNFSVVVRTGGNLTMPKTAIKSNMEEDHKEIMENFLFSYSEVTIANYLQKGMRNVANRVEADIRKVLASDLGWGTNASKLEIPFTDENGNSKVIIITFDT